jgi:hypothetical protein
MQDEIARGAGSVLRFILFHVVWEIILFNLGRATLLLFTLGRYPRGRWVELHSGRIGFAGVAVVLLLWVGAVAFNRTVGA